MWAIQVRKLDPESEDFANDLLALAVLFDQYRCFYGQRSDVAGGAAFLQERLAKRQSIIFLAVCGGEIVGFAQLYPTWSSAAMMPVMIVNDLFVARSARRAGVAKCLLRQVARHGKKAGAVRLTLATSKSNIEARTLYESSYWCRVETSVTYDYFLERSVSLK